jgi:hypothetical protein
VTVSADQFLRGYGELIFRARSRFRSSSTLGRSIEKEPASSGPESGRRGDIGVPAGLRSRLHLKAGSDHARVRAPGRDVRSLCDNGGVWQGIPHPPVADSGFLAKPLGIAKPLPKERRLSNSCVASPQAARRIPSGRVRPEDAPPDFRRDPARTGHDAARRDSGRARES